MNSARARAIYIIGLLGVVSLMFNSASSRVRLGAKDGVRKERCLIETDGKVHFKGPCWVGSSSGATHIVSIGRHRKPMSGKDGTPSFMSKCGTVTMVLVPRRVTSSIVIS